MSWPLISMTLPILNRSIQLIFSPSDSYFWTLRNSQWCSLSVFVDIDISLKSIDLLNGWETYFHFPHRLTRDLLDHHILHIFILNFFSFIIVESLHYFLQVYLLNLPKLRLWFICWTFVDWWLNHWFLYWHLQRIFIAYILKITPSPFIS
jgi:hypothetical protein